MPQTELRFTQPRESTVSIEKRADGKRVIVGYASVFYNSRKAGTESELWSGVVERIASTAFDRALADKHDARGVFNHNSDNLLGRVGAGTVRLSKDDRGLKYEIDVDEEDPDHKRVVRKIERGDLAGSSFAFTATRVEWTAEKNTEVRTILDVDLYDVGPVTYPAYEGTSTGLRSSDKTSIEAERSDWKQKLQAEAEAQAADTFSFKARARAAEL